jgi:N-acetylmuramoyl-L-alanine amidase
MTKRKTGPKKRASRSRKRPAASEARSPLVTLMAIGMFGIIAAVMFGRINQNGAASVAPATAQPITQPPVNQTVIGVAATPTPAPAASPIPTRPPATPRPTVSAASVAKRIGIVSGHRNNDSGAVCDDGLTEAKLNFDHATRVAARLRAEGYTVDILDEFDDRLDW